MNERRLALAVLAVMPCAGFAHVQGLEVGTIYKPGDTVRIAITLKAHFRERACCSRDSRTLRATMASLNFACDGCAAPAPSLSCTHLQLARQRFPSSSRF
jgi:hypothetical protein